MLSGSQWNYYDLERSREFRNSQGLIKSNKSTAFRSQMERDDTGMVFESGPERDEGKGTVLREGSRSPLTNQRRER